MSDAGRCFEDVVEGEALPVLTKQPDLVEVVKWSGATWTFVPIFYDRDLAMSQGLPDTLIPGPMKLAFLHLLLDRWSGSNGFIRSIRCSYRRPDGPKRRLTCHGVVTHTHIEADRGLVDVELWIENDRGERTASGAATLDLPRRTAIAR
ncbi:MAG: hotdog family protein [Dehalococcoidia bacterium]